METHEILIERWPSFFSDFTQLYQGKHVHVETMGEGALGARSCLCDLPLVGIVAAQPQGGADEWIEVIARGKDDTYATHSIIKPERVELAEEENGQTIALQIESADGSITMIRFEPPCENLPAGFRIS